MNSPVAFIACAAGNTIDLPGGCPIGAYDKWATQVGPRLRRRGITRVMLHNPGGYFAPVIVGGDPRGMRVDQWQIAERYRCTHADRFDFRTAVGILDGYGVTEVIIYVGSPTQLLDPVRELPQVLEVFTDCGPIVSFGFDAVFEDGIGQRWQDLWNAAGEYRMALASLRKKHKVYAEARIHPPQLKAGLGKLVDGTIADPMFDRRTNYDPKLQPGEYIRLTETGNQTSQWPDVDTWPAGITPCLRHELNWGPLMGDN